MTEDIATTVLPGTPQWEAWEPSFKPSWLALEPLGPNKARVVRINPGAVLSRGKARLYEAWLGDRKVSDPATEYAVGQVIRL